MPDTRLPLEERVHELLVNLDTVLRVLRAGCAEGHGATVKQQRELLRALQDASQTVSELHGAMVAYRECATNARGGTALLPATDPEARRLHLSDEDLR